MSTKILVLYYSRGGSVRKMAEEIARGIESIADCEAMLRTVPPVATITEKQAHQTTAEKDPYASLEDLKICDGLAVGSPTRFGNMAAPMKYFWDTTGDDWFSGTLIGKPAAVFTSTATMHSGQESTLLSMMIPLLHHGLLIVGVPASEAASLSTKTGGSFYGPTHFAGPNNDPNLSEDEIKICRSLGKRLAEVSVKLKG
ncbi:MAG: NAD(P)H-quinone oxidoreductase [Gammaproteobacteria bacterium]|jgi:NAD(P)H dehydrogenase (quinone)|nr:NAD(P)H-quinone oxidoreductase [Gammaproteobacteria bacterium]